MLEEKEVQLGRRGRKKLYFDQRKIKHLRSNVMLMVLELMVYYPKRRDMWHFLVRS
jgi:hypothetical protein